MEIKANHSFADWSKSYSGCDGGNISASIWFCGIEFGGGHTEETLKFKPVNIPPYVDEKLRAKFITRQYNWKILKLYATILGYTPKEYTSVYKSSVAFDKSSDVFKLNLYPIAFHNKSTELWEEWHYKKTGFPSKPLYQSWCQLNRFPLMKQWVNKNAPKAIICTGSTYLREFLMAFSGIQDAFAIMHENQLDGSALLWKEINEGKTILFVIPFLGQGGLKSDVQLEKYGHEINVICETHFGKSWCRAIKTNA